MKKFILILSLLSFFTLGSQPVNRVLVKLTIINKSGEELFIRLDNIEPYYENHIFYNFTIPVGYKTDPTVRAFTIYRDIYTMQVSYVREWDPVYTYSPCSPGIHELNLFATRNQRLTFTKCTQTPPRPGEDSMEKIWQGTTVDQRSIALAFRNALDPIRIYAPTWWLRCFLYP
ncbi:MAG: hypothetical protein ACK2U3_08655 [Anaerolineales bacterium]|jgi:hypothetical protein